MTAMGRGRVKTKNICGGFPHSGDSAIHFGLELRNRGQIFAKKTAYYAVIAFIRGLAPKICIIRFRLYANTCKLISVLTRSNVLVRK
jgi:hypothetical protein